MAKEDHDVAQTYLRSFANDTDKLWVYRKDRPSIKELSTKSICWEHAGSDNPYFEKNRIIEDYLKIFENGWPKALRVFASNPTLEEYLNAKFIMSGFIAYLRFFPPGPAKAGQQFLEEVVKSEMRQLKKQGLLPAPPKGYEYLLENIESSLRVDVDKTFAQAQGIRAMIKTCEVFFHSPWMRVTNSEGIPFVSSDNPACMWYPNPSSRGVVYFPTSPTTAVLINPSTEWPEGYDQTMDAEGPSKPGAATIFNSLIVKSAEKYVVANTNSKTILEMVTEFKNWRYRCTTSVIKINTGELLIPKLQPLPDQS